MRNLSFALCFLLIGCGGEDVVDGTGDTGQVVIDTGQAAADAGVQGQDAAVIPQVDAGDTPATDTGVTPSEDAGRPPRPDDGGPRPRPDVGGPQPPRDAGAGGGGQTCIQVMECSMRCEDQACMDACVDRAQPGAHRRAAQAMMQCSRDNDCANAANMQQCMMQNCMRQAQACGQAGGGGGPPGPGADGGVPPNQPDIGPPPGPGDVGPGGGGTPPGQDRSCSEALGCANQCGAQNQQCIMNCFGGIRQSSNGVVDSLLNCVGRSCGLDFGQCATDNCAAQMQACRNDR